MLPHRVKDIEVIEGADLKPVITDNFLIVPIPKTSQPGQTLRVVFRATRIENPD